jgi:hypothetical protein
MNGSQGHFVWVEIGRATPGAGAPWTAWMTPLPGGGALYRTLTVADGALTVAVDVQRHRGAEVRDLHRGHRDITRTADAESITGLLASADEAARAALARPVQGGGTAPVAPVPSATAAARRQFAAIPLGA